MQKIIPFVLFALVGCGGNSEPLIPPTAGDFVRNNDGVGTAQVFGIGFSAKATSSGASTEDAIESSFIEPSQSSAKKRFTFGDDITIQLDGVDESTVRFLFNNQDYGTLKVGDKVLIDDERNVEVNETPRSPNLGE